MTADKKVRSTLTVQSVLTTSDKSYARKISDKEDTQDLEKKDSDQAGPFSVAMTAEDKYAENTKVKAMQQEDFCDWFRCLYGCAKQQLWLNNKYYRYPDGRAVQ